MDKINKEDQIVGPSAIHLISEGKHTQKRIRKFLVKKTLCDLHNGWPCRTCLNFYLISELGFDNLDEFYEEA